MTCIYISLKCLYDKCSTIDKNPMRFYIHTNQWVSIFLEHNFSFQGSIILIVCNASTCLPTYLSHTQWLNVVYKVMCLCRNGASGNKSKERTVRIYGMWE